MDSVNFARHKKQFLLKSIPKRLVFVMDRTYINNPQELVHHRPAVRISCECLSFVLYIFLESISVLGDCFYFLESTSVLGD